MPRARAQGGSQLNVAVVGLGLIGGSLLRALAAAGHWVIGYDSDPATRAMARTAAAQAPEQERWLVAPTIRDAIAEVELVAIATPLTAVATVLDEVAGSGYTGIITDVVSVKEPVRALVPDRLRRVGTGQRLAGYVGGHPMAGRETAGFAVAEAGLFNGCAWALCLDEETALADWLTVAQVLTKLGARVVPTTAQAHDLAVAAVSHVPHLLAAALATTAAEPLAATLAAGSFRDGTRVAASPPALTAAMCAGNAGPVLAALDAIMDRLEEARTALLSREPASAVRAWATPAQEIRSAWPRGWGAPTRIAATATQLLTLGAEGGWVTGVGADHRTVVTVRPV